LALTTYTHDEPITREPHFLVHTPNRNYTGERLGVIFRKGVGRTRSHEKAKRFDEEFNYEVIPPSEGFTPWALKPSNFMESKATEYPREDSVPVVEEDESY
jgi:hypothetical protein